MTDRFRLTSDHLERSRDRGANQMHASERFCLGKGVAGIERLEAYLYGEAFSRHRHDTYAIGITLSGVQSFYYRGEQRYCTPNQYYVLHPDEDHDGMSGTETGFGYCIAYISPSLIQQALGGKPLPFVPDPILTLTRSQKRRLARLWDMDDPIDELGRIEMVEALSGVLIEVTASKDDANKPLPLERLMRVRDLVASDPARRRSLAELESVADLDRWALARKFRSAFGTSPTRFRTMRQLDLARACIMRGRSLSDAALEAGFADQAHMTRKFGAAYGLSPARWAAALK
jgi:AraC-like DNA-binding protein